MPQIVEALKQGMLDGTADSPAFRDAPIFLKEELTFPYRYGLDFTLALARREGRNWLTRAHSRIRRRRRAKSWSRRRTWRTRRSPMKMIDMEKDFKATIPSISAPSESLTLMCWSSSMPAGMRQRRCIRSGAADIILPGKPRRQIGADRSAVCFPLVESGESGGVRGGVCKIAGRSAIRSGKGWDDGKVAEDAPPADSWRTLRGRHAWLTEEGAVVIEVRGDAVLISESLDDETTKRAEEDFWPRKTEKAGPLSREFRLV